MSDSPSEKLYDSFFWAEAMGPSRVRQLWVGRGKELRSLHQHFEHKGPQQAMIIGQRGSGKTALAYMFREQTESRDVFPAGWRFVRATPFRHVAAEFFGDAFQNIRNQQRSLLCVDDYSAGSDFFRSLLWKYLDQNPSQDLLICSDGEIPKEMSNPLVLPLGGLSQEEFFQLLQQSLIYSGVDRAKASELFRLVDGNPLYAELAGMTIREHVLTLQQFVQGMQSFSRSGILGPDGKPLNHIPNAIKLDVVDTNQILLQRLRAHPEELYLLEARKFEELVADVLVDRGYDITLTPPSQDGGFDMFAARKDDLGSFLYLVECKRYTPPHKVGVSIVRALHGVVQQQQANAGIVITSSFFTKGAREFQENVPYQMQLRDYLALQKWLSVI